MLTNRFELDQVPDRNYRVDCSAFSCFNVGGMICYVLKEEQPCLDQETTFYGTMIPLTLPSFCRRISEDEFIDVDSTPTKFRAQLFQDDVGTHSHMIWLLRDLSVAPPANFKTYNTVISDHCLNN